MSFVLGAMMVIGTGLQMFSQIREGQQESAIYEHNAKVQQQQAELIGKQAKIEEKRERRKAVAFTGTQKSSASALGIVADRGSPLEVMIADAGEMELDAQLIQYNSKLDQLNALAGADMSLMRAQQARSSAFVGAGTSLLTGIPRASKFFNKA